MKNIKRKRVSIFGGSFSPITKGHIKVAELVLKNDLADTIMFMPAYTHNLGKELIDPLHRLEMIYRSTKGKKNMVVSDYEIVQESTGKMLDTIEYFLEAYPKVDFSVIIGLDNALSISNWYEWERLIDLVPFIVVNRNGYDFWINDYWFEKAPHILIKDKMRTEYSSTLARTAIKNNDNNLKQRLLYQTVIDYIENQGLYK